MRIFSPDSPFSKAMDLVGDLILLNLCFLLCALPVVTAGASFTALYTATLAIAEGRDGNVVRRFFRGFRRNFVQATLIWAVMVLGAGMLFLFYRLILGLNVSFRFWLLAVLVLFCIVYIMVLNMVFPLLAKYENTVPGTLKNALALGLSHPFHILVMTAVTVFPLLLPAAGEELFMRGMILWILIAFSASAQINSFIVKRVFKRAAGPSGPAE